MLKTGILLLSFLFLLSSPQNGFAGKKNIISPAEYKEDYSGFRGKKRRALKNECLEKYGDQLRASTEELIKKRRALKIQYIEARKEALENDEPYQKHKKELDVLKRSGARFSKGKKHKAALQNQRSKILQLKTRERKLGESKKLKKVGKEIRTLRSKIRRKRLEILGKDEKCKDLLIRRHKARVKKKIKSKK